MESPVVHIGVDVSKEKLDIYDPSTGEEDTVPNDKSGYGKIRDMALETGAVVCCEPTGGLDVGLVLFLAESGVEAARCDGARVRMFAESMGEFSKNDRIDAAMISRYADAAGSRGLSGFDARRPRLQSMWAAYRALRAASAELARAAASMHDAWARRKLSAEAGHAGARAAEVLDKCMAFIREDARAGRLLDAFLDVDGIGPVTAVAVIAGVPEIGAISDSKLAKLVGVAPMQRQSGKTDHARHVFGGRRDVRNALYMAAVAAGRCNHVLRPYYERLKARMPGKKASKWALLPVMRKLLLLMNRIARDPGFKPQSKHPAKTA